MARTVKSVEPSIAAQPSAASSNSSKYSGYSAVRMRDLPKQSSTSSTWRQSVSARSFGLSSWSGSTFRNTLTSFRRRFW